MRVEQQQEGITGVRDRDALPGLSGRRTGRPWLESTPGSAPLPAHQVGRDLEGRPKVTLRHQNHSNVPEQRVPARDLWIWGVSTRHRRQTPGRGSPVERACFFRRGFSILHILFSSSAESSGGIRLVRGHPTSQMANFIPSLPYATSINTP